MLDSLYTGTAGIKANSTALGIVGANIANVSTVGYKTAKTSFQNVLSTAMGSGHLGSKEVWTQGSLEQTSVTTDFAIVGEGLFQLKDAAGSAYYTRDGAFHLDENGLLTNTTGLKVQGFKISNNGELSAAGDIQIANINSSPVATTQMGLDFNLDGVYTAANVVVDCSDDFSAVTYTALVPGQDSNDIIIRYIDSGSGGPGVTADGTLVTVDLGGQELTAAQTAAMVNAHFNVSADVEIGTGDAAVLFVANDAGADGEAISLVYAAASATATEVGISVAGKVITVTPALGGSTAAEIADAINASGEASLLVTAIAKGDGDTDVIAPVAATKLAIGMNYLFGGAASYTIGTDDDAVLFVANEAGTSGNSITVEYVTGAGSEVTVDVTGDAITVNLASGGSTAAEIAAAVTADSSASALVTAYAAGSGGVTAAVAATNLENGTPDVPSVLVKAKAGGDGSGLIEVSAPVRFAGGAEPAGFSNTIGVYDSLGNQINVTTDFIFDPALELDSNGHVNRVSQWFWSVRSSEGSINGISGVLDFDSSGQLDRVKSTWTNSLGTTETLRDGGNPKIIVSELNSGAADLNIEWDLSITTNVTGFAGLSEVTAQSQNGYTSGNLKDLSVDEDGIVSGTFSNGATRDLYQVGVAAFQNYNGLGLRGTNLFAATDESGGVIFGEAGSGGRGSISSGSLELSNVDLAEEFVNMITIQRAYQANSRVITTSSDILQELINLKR